MPIVNARTESEFDPLAGECSFDIVGAALNYRAGTVLEMHSHAMGQFLYAISGAMFVRTEKEIFIVPPHMAVWLPPRTAHSVSMPGSTSMRTVYFAKEYKLNTDNRCVVLAVPDLVRELILALIDRQELERDTPDLILVSTLLRAEIARAKREPLGLSAPRDRRVQKLVTAAMADKINSGDLSRLLKEAGLSRRTAERIFARETGLTLGRWLRHARLLSSISDLAQGKPVTETALDNGYSTSSAYAQMFKNILGVSPTEYFSRRRSLSRSSREM